MVLQGRGSDMAKGIQCKICKSTLHYQTFCPLKPKPRIKTESDKAKKKRHKTNRVWYKKNPPDADGYWTCYLQISTRCPKRLTLGMLTKEHVQPKVKAPHLKYNPDNIKPSCSWCNRLKSSQSIEALSKIYPHLRRYL